MDVSSKIGYFIVSVCSLLVAAIIHEFSHGYVAFKLGDNTAKSSGRLTLNPFAHIDPIGTILMPIVLYFLIGVPLGSAKPVPVNFYNLRRPKVDMIYVSAAGPLSNFGVAVICGLMFKFFGIFIQDVPILQSVLMILLMVNLLVGLFNLIPIPPLDGSRIVMGLLPYKYMRYYAKFEPYGFFILLLLVWVGSKSGITSEAYTLVVRGFLGLFGKILVF